MNYRHAFHAGNFADVMKHAFLCRVLLYLGTKTAPYRVIDTHAGCGIYDLTSSAAQRSPEWKDGIGRLIGAKLPRPIEDLLRPYLAIVEPLMQATTPNYPGSPLLALALARTQDSLCFVEKHPADTLALKAAVAGDRRARALTLDGWTAWNAQVPPSEKRGLVLVDPPFEEPGEFHRLGLGLAAAHRKWPTGISMLWYPIKDGRAVGDFIDTLAETGIRRVLRLEMWVGALEAEGPLAGTGLIIVNPPYTLKQEAETLLPFLAHRLSRGPRHGWRAEWVTPE